MEIEERRGKVGGVQMLIEIKSKVEFSNTILR
jgi:hypothetical protein